MVAVVGVGCCRGGGRCSVVALALGCLWLSSRALAAAPRRFARHRIEVASLLRGPCRLWHCLGHALEDLRRRAFCDVFCFVVTILILLIYFLNLITFIFCISFHFISCNFI